MQKQIVLEKKIWKKFGVWKKIWCLRKVLVQNNFGLENFFVSNKIAGPKKIWSKEIWSKNILAHKNDEPQKIGSKKFGQNRSSNSWDIADMDKCHQGICYLN